MMLAAPFHSWREGRRCARRQKAAQTWVVKLDAGALSLAEEKRFRDWLSDVRNLEELRRYGAIWENIDLAVMVAPATSLRGSASPARRSRRAIVKATGVTTAMLALSVMVMRSDIWIALQADARTGVGESHRLALADGSAILLDAQSAVDIRYSPGERRVRLLQGRARFEAAAVPGRPFIVEAGSGETHALGTIFDVDREDDGVRVVAVHHNIEVKAGHRHVLLRPGQSVRYQNQLSATVVRSPTFDDWTRGQVVFDGARLDVVVSALQRYVPQHILVWGAARSRRFSGVIRTSDPLNGLEALAQGGQLRIASWPGLLIIRAK